MGDLVLGILSISLIGLVLLGVLAVWSVRSARRKLGTAAGTVCPECGGDLLGYEDSFTCPHCYAILGESEEDMHDDEGASVDEEQEWDEDDDAQPLP